jgi:hypothetical protein
MQLDQKAVKAAEIAAFKVRTGEIEGDELTVYLQTYLEAAPSPSPAPGVATDEMVEAAARAIDLDAFTEYERRLQYNAHKEPESERRKFADHYDTRPAAIETARAALEAALASLSQPAKEREGERS